MLKAIELHGFKSFADKTRFEFPTGITVIVGPNGSGKSNVVDAIKWVLGEQSPKSLRGKEMADVIFNGSGSRRPLNSADVTLTLNNRGGLLAVDSPEVQITRRVFRSGEGEYLINRQPSRLRDIRELFAGTGVATEAYSVIEQGKVDVLLQSSPRERRMIFEEAAGISRFKAKKVEAARRLERVEQNLLRLSDIVEEVESRLRSVRLQASKARRYREYATRLEELRTQLGLADWRRISAALAEIEAELAALALDGDRCRAEIERIEADALGVETEIIRLDETIRAGEGQLAALREQIAAAESLIEHERTRGRELDEETARHRRQQTALSARAGDVEHQLSAATEASKSLTQQAADLAARLAADERSLADCVAELQRGRAASEARRTEYLAQMREAGALSQEISTLETRREAAEQIRHRADERIGQLTEASLLVGQELHEANDQQQQSQVEVDRLAASMETLQTRLAELRQRHSEQQTAASDLRVRRTAAQERATLLAELEQKHEGLSAGVKQALSDARSNADSLFRDVRGLVADVLDVNVDMAPLVDVALGDIAGHLVVGNDRALFDALAEGRCPLSGRVALVRYDLQPAAGWIRPTDYTGQSGVIGRADRFVRAEADFAVLVERLLSHTWIVESLHVALALAPQAGREQQFVTLAGELVTADGLIVVGPRLAATGLVSRRSELRSLREQIVALEGQVRAGDTALAELAAAIATSESENKSLTAQHRQAQQTNAEHRARRRTAEDRHAQLAEQLAQLHGERAGAEADRDASAARLDELVARRGALEASLIERQAAIDADKTRLDALDARRAALVAETTTAKVELAKTEEQLGHHREQLRQFELHREERHRAIQESLDQLAQCAAKAIDSQRKILRAESEVAELYLKKETAAVATRGQVEIRERQRAGRGELAAQAQKLRARLRVIDDTSHERQLAAGELRHERTTLVDRLREDYNIDLPVLAARAERAATSAPTIPMQGAPATDDDTNGESPGAEAIVESPTDATNEDLGHETTGTPFDRAAVEQEITELRRRINSVGGVNLDALEELDELETRHAALAAQHKDLSDAKSSLAQIIERINADSRRLFSETLETVRGHFQQLFRKLFGGGQADIVLEEAVDILDAGIEIVARPPGKEPRSISLLSGGEKTLTCVALLLAIFRSRPSPFCVLDEVDAALDEANIERFVGVLREFLTITQFIVVTHSKKTMTAASTLYGVTMQESGVSKRVSVRFEDVSETGEISAAAVARSIPEAAGDGTNESAGDGDDETQAA